MILKTYLKLSRIHRRFRVVSSMHHDECSIPSIQKYKVEMIATEWTRRMSVTASRLVATIARLDGMMPSPTHPASSSFIGEGWCGGLRPQRRSLFWYFFTGLKIFHFRLSPCCWIGYGTEAIQCENSAAWYVGIGHAVISNEENTAHRHRKLPRSFQLH